MANNFYGNKNAGKKLNNENKSRPKSNNYRKPKIDLYNFYNSKSKKKRSNNFKKNNVNNNSKNSNLINNNFLFNCKRAKSSKAEVKKNLNILSRLNSNTNNIDENKLLTLEETQYLCDKMIEKMKHTFELVKEATLGD